MKVISRAAALVLVLSLSTLAQHPEHAPATMNQPATDNAMPHSLHAGGSSVTYAELKTTMALLDRARQATAKYQDVRVAEAAGANYLRLSARNERRLATVLRGGGVTVVEVLLRSRGRRPLRRAARSAASKLKGWILRTKKG